MGKSNNTKVKIEKPDEESKLSKKGNTRKGKNKKRDEVDELMLKDDIEGEQASHTETEEHNAAEDPKPQSSSDTDDIKKKEETATSEVSDNDGEDSEEEELPSVKVKVGKQQQKKKKKGRKQIAGDEDEKENCDDGLSRGSLTCAQCNGTFPSKNKLYTHLKDTGHAVFLPKSGGNALNSNDGQKKKKKGKK